MHLYARTVNMPPHSDPATAGVTTGTAFCPSGYRATGGGYKSSQLVLVPDAEMFTNAYKVIAANLADQSGKLEVDVICIKGTTSASSASKPNAGLATQLAKLRRERRAMHP